jgi:hypothetical protein
MALIPVHFTIAGQWNFDNSSATAVAPGTCLKPTADADEVVYVSTASATSAVVGVAADGFRTETIDPPASGYADDIVVGADGNTTTRTQNRISDLYRETAGSGKMTVYSGVGTFRTTAYSSAVTWSGVTIGASLYSDASGLLTNSNGGGTKVGYLLQRPVAFPSGVPGSDVDGSMSLGTYLTFNMTL